MRILSLAVPLALLACHRPPDTASTPAANPKPAPRAAVTEDAPPHVPAGTPLEKKLLQAAVSYLRYGRVDDETRWAPSLCRNPEPSRGRLSGASAASSHGRKLYYLFAENREAYLQAGQPGFRQPVGQVVVKEAWMPDEVPGMSPADIHLHIKDCYMLGGYVPYAAREGKVYHAGRRAGLFIMLKTDDPTAEADEGWVYATTSADGRSLTSSGRVPSCMRCHRDAPSDRLFGLK